MHLLYILINLVYTPRRHDWPTSVRFEQAFELMDVHIPHIIISGILSLVKTWGLLISDVSLLVTPIIVCKWRLAGIHEALGTSSLFFGHLLSIYPWEIAARLIGRKTCLLIGITWIALCSHLLSNMSTLMTYMVMRFLMGSGLGCLYITNIIIKEIIRNPEIYILKTILNSTLVFGKIFGSLYAGGLFVSSDGWRSYHQKCAYLALPLFILVLVFVPETPHFFMSWDDPSNAENSLRKLNPELMETFSLKAVEHAHKRKLPIEICLEERPTIASLTMITILSFIFLLISILNSSVLLMFIEKLRVYPYKDCQLDDVEDCHLLDQYDFWQISILAFDIGYGILQSQFMMYMFSLHQTLLICLLITMISSAIFYMCTDFYLLMFFTLVAKVFLTTAMIILTDRLKQIAGIHPFYKGGRIAMIAKQFGWILSTFLISWLYKTDPLASELLLTGLAMFAIIFLFFLKFELIEIKSGAEDLFLEEEVIEEEKRLLVFEEEAVEESNSSFSSERDTSA